MWSRLAAAHTSGSLYLGLSAASAASAGALYLIQSQEAEDRRRVDHELVRMPVEAKRKATAKTEETLARLRAAPVLWDGIVTRCDPSLVGHAMLTGSKPGSAVEVLEERTVGEGSYYTVRDVETGKVGLHPASWVERAEG